MRLLRLCFWVGIGGFVAMGIGHALLLELTHECVCEAVRDFAMALLALGLRALVPEPPVDPNRLRIFPFEEDKSA